MIKLKEKPHIQILYLNERGKVTKPQEAEPMNLKAHIIDRDEHHRKIVAQGNSLFVSHKQGWLNMIAKEGFVESCLLLLSENEYGILLTTPKQGENKS